MYMVLCQTESGGRYHVFTDEPEVYEDHRQWQLGPIKDVYGGLFSECFKPEEWDARGDAKAAFGEAQDVYEKLLAAREAE